MEPLQNNTSQNDSTFHKYREATLSNRRILQQLQLYTQLYQIIEYFTSCFCVKSLRYLLYTNLLKKYGMVEK